MTKKQAFLKKVTIVSGTVLALSALTGCFGKEEASSKEKGKKKTEEVKKRRSLSRKRRSQRKRRKEKKNRILPMKMSCMYLLKKNLHLSLPR
ncbi:hypothetical protein [Bacillus thuringiensis]|uniref:hypothetical protein n=1 Tax=Bacillus thuringiensis TaxID=1428 RepID=UPI001E2F2ADF|nr:hypothetical protein [Bacillus thuringiensis]